MIVYETGGFYFPYMIVGSLLLVLYGIYWIKHLKIDNRFYGFQKGFMIFWLCFAVLFTVLSVYSVTDEYITVVIGYKSDHFEEVEGVVSGLERNRKGTREMFSVDDVLFEYSVYTWGEMSYGGHAQYGGVISENGQHVKVRYIPYRKYNRIVYIELED